MEITTCIPCQHGDHEEHRDIIEVPTPGMLGGSRCGCKGECRDTAAKLPDIHDGPKTAPGERWGDE